LEVIDKRNGKLYAMKVIRAVERYIESAKVKGSGKIAESSPF
jgi:hypothetical protein